MKTATFTLLSTVLAGSLGLAPAPVEAHCKGKHTGSHPHCLGGEGGTLHVKVDFRDSVVFPAPDRLMSDGLGFYIHKEDKVRAGIDSPGNLAMNLTKGNQLAIRTLTLDFSVCESAPEDCKPPVPTIVDTVAGANVFTSNVDLRAMGEGELNLDLKLRVAFDLSRVGGGLWILFLEEQTDADCPYGSDDTNVTRTSSTSWEIESTGYACLSRRGISGGVHEFSGLYHMPFLITVTEK